ncbi:MAG TPA: hypothetical protein VIJ27_08920 [Mucilaginibacter sp.]
MAEITYLLGAGASYNALPVVDEMYKKIGEAIKWFRLEYNKAFLFSVDGKIVIPKGHEKIQNVVSDLEWLQGICDTSRNFSVDTFARKLDLSGKREDYIKLKNILSLYFTLEQRRNLPDVRYDNFWASILKSRTEFPNNVKIISWNYDFQLELTYQDFFGHDSLKVAREALNVTSQETDFVDLPDPDKFGVFKLNGSATFNTNSIENRDTNYLIDKFKTSSIGDFIKGLVETYEKLCTTPRVNKNHLTFAWEHRIDNPFYKHLKESIKNTEILVTIGYSFPFFNRDIDKLILKDLMGKNLKKVYFQAPDAEDLRERFLAINDRIDPMNLVLRKDLKQFTLPNEL